MRSSRLPLAVTFLGLGLVAQAPRFERIERNHFDVVPALPDVQAGDLDGDGDMDLLYHDLATARVYYNDGHAVFTAGETLQLPSLKGGIALADLHGSGAVSVISRSSVGIAVIERIGGVFVVTSTITAPLALSAQFAVADFDADGDVDVIECYANAFTGASRPMYLDNRNGTLVPDVGAGPLDSGAFYGAVSGDIDGDGRLDLLAWKGVEVVGYRGLGGGLFDAPRSLYLGVYGGTTAAGRLWIGDLDADGDLDLAVVSRVFVSDAIVVLSNDGAGSFTSTFSSGAVLQSLAIVGIADVDQNGRRDLLVETSSIRRLGINSAQVATLGWQPLSGGVLVAGGSLAMETAGVLFQYAREYVVADLDGDLDVDVAGPEGKLLLRATGATFGRAVVSNPEVYGASITAASARVGAFTGLPGVGVLSLGANGVSNRLFLPNMPGGAVATDTAMLSGWMLATADTGVHVARGPYSSWESYSPLPLTQARWLATFPGGFGSVRAMVSCADFPCGLAILLRSGAVVGVDQVASAALPAPRLVGHGYDKILSCDIEGDGLPDVIHSFRWVKWVGNSFVDVGDIVPVAPSNVRDIVAFDYDGDGDQDLYIGRAGFDMLLEKTSAGFVDATFGHVLPESGDCSAVSAGDIDGDGDVDLLVVGANGTPTRWLRNEGGTFSVSIASVADPLRLDDIDADGDADLLTASGYLRNTVRQLSAPHLPRLGGDYRLRLYGGAIGRPSVGAVFSGSSLSSTVPGVEGLLLVDAATLAVFGVDVLQGSREFVVPIPSSPVLFGQSFVAQGLFLESSGRAVFSNGIVESVQ